ncbi:helix-turn-helix domain-containing protein [Streptomonospora sp. S1-112]|uniref:Helix-turn-helix domain-containing protein n=1 Tax=Streptomonospora mangrovi TaxID=2883123 RepID=A0A9X3SH73_9ACTN|nr:helix-turn-helix domain-containing protein [Streptomonospora mangrovi]MDA0567627.1 helix-turn-helix domain-containing protein [Streptomonospora mangrovi]
MTEDTTAPAGGGTGARSGAAGTRSQTLDRGIRALELLHRAGRPMSIAELARGLEVHRSIIYRILRTLEDHRLVARTPEGAYELGLGLPVLARGVSHDLQSAALPVLSALADEVAMTAFLVVPSGAEAITLTSVEPRLAPAHVAHAPGVRHPLDRGAPGIALLAAQAPQPHERPEVAQARARGWAYSRDEVLAGMSSVAAPVPGPPARPGAAAVAVIYVEGAHGDDDTDRAALAERVRAAAKEIAADLP